MTSVRYALRSLRRTPLFTATAIVTFVLGVGAVASTFAIVHGVLLAPLQFGDPDRLVTITLDAQATGTHRIAQPAALYVTYRQHARRMDGIGFYRVGNANVLTPGADVIAERVTAAWVTASTIPLLEVPPLLGRSFTEEEAQLRGRSFVVLSESMWRARFRADPAVIGKTVSINGIAREIVGVMPARFTFPTAEARLWLPVRIDPAASAVSDFAYTGIGRLAPGSTPAAAQRELAAILPKLVDSYPRLESGGTAHGWIEELGLAPVVVPLREDMTQGIARTFWMLAGAAALVLVVAWANVTNLMLIRADSRQLELAVREALGASQRRILTHFLGESLVLCCVSALLALGVAWGAVRALVAFGPADVPRLGELSLSLSTVGFVCVVALIGAIVCSVVPVLRTTRAARSINLRDGSRADTSGKARQHVRSVIGALQIAVALVVLVGSALLLRTFRNLYGESPGFDAANVMTVWTQLPFARYDDSAAVSYYARLAAATSAIPGVQSVGLTSRLPLGEGESTQLSFYENDQRNASLAVVAVDDGYFEALKIPFLAGHGFQRTGVQRSGEIIISRRVAQRLWNDPTGATAIGRRLVLAPAGPAYDVIGVAGDVRDEDLGRPPSAIVYTPQAIPREASNDRAARRTMALVIRTTVPPVNIVNAVRAVVYDLDPSVPTFNIEAMSDVVRASTARLSLALTLMSAAALITLILATIGLYGIIAYMVTLRTRELGIRVALGADPRDLARSVATRGLVMAGAGIAAGLALYGLASPFLRAFLYGVTPSDPASLGAAMLALVCTAVLASWIPARRAARVDPAATLRAE